MLLVVVAVCVIVVVEVEFAAVTVALPRFAVVVTVTGGAAIVITRDNPTQLQALLRAAELEHGDVIEEDGVDTEDETGSDIEAVGVGDTVELLDKGKTVGV